jgi:hypothetical protein
MESAWYYVRDGKQTGPISFEELKAAAASGQFAPDDLVWQEGAPDWVGAETVPGLFASPLAPSAPPAPPVRTKRPAAEPLPPDDRLAEPLPLDDRGGRSLGGGNPYVAIAMEFVRRVGAPNPATITPTPDEDERLTRAGIVEPTARKYAIWRRAVLWVAAVMSAFAAFFGFIAAIAQDTDGLSGFGILLVWVEALVLFALPTFAVLAALAYDRSRDSARWVLIGAVVSIGVPIALAFVPAAARIDLQTTSSTTLGEVQAAEMFVGVLVGLGLYMTLLPLVLSLLPAASRACVRMKGLLPQSLVPGWGLVASVPLFVLLTLATVVLLYQFVGNFLLILGLLLWIGAPLLYLTKIQLLTRPLTQKRDMDALAKTQTGVLVMITAGVVLLIIYLFSSKAFGRPIMGTDETALLRPWSIDIHRTWIEFVGRSLFMTVLFADLLLWIALSVWREERAFAGTEGAAAFDRTMTGLAENLGPKRAAG